MGTSRRVRLEISGRVQGVGFRYSAQRHATALGLTGWVRNRADGTVEAIAEGPEAAIASFISWARRGPPGANVEHLGVYDDIPSGATDTFRIER